MSYKIHLDFLDFLVLSAMGGAFSTPPGGPLVVLWSFYHWCKSPLGPQKGHPIPRQTPTPVAKDQRTKKTTPHNGKR